ncbi:hypothetical protein V1292_002418 [Bradyrhizobium sp. AZCC 1719]|uniref:YciI family protein n=1 Tax=Bradyrhizobium sp. AZCC 1719 TaxID=3117028 RepID=UPI002FF41D31
MRFMVIVKASKDTEAGVMPSTELLTAMGKFNEELVKAGVMEAGEGLHPTSKGARIKYGSGQSVTRGPFAQSGDLVCGFWLINTNSLDEAIDWMKRAPFADGDEIEIRQVFAAEDFGEALTPELREQEERLRAQTAKK